MLAGVGAGVGAGVEGRMLLYVGITGRMHIILIKPSQMEVAPLHRTVVISHKRRLFKNTNEI